MRTTLDIDLDVLRAVKELGRRSKRSAGQILSELARKTLVSSGPGPSSACVVVNGFEIVSAGERIVTPELVQQLMEESDPP